MHFEMHRFQSARTALELIEKAKKANEKLPDESRFDSNCITPGTEFMERLQQAFKHFVKLKLSTDPAWKHCRIILSGHEVQHIHIYCTFAEQAIFNLIRLASLCCFSNQM